MSEYLSKLRRQQYVMTTKAALRKVDEIKSLMAELRGVCDFAHVTPVFGKAYLQDLQNRVNQELRSAQEEAPVHQAR